MKRNVLVKSQRPDKENWVCKDQGGLENKGRSLGTLNFSAVEGVELWSDSGQAGPSPGVYVN